MQRSEATTLATLALGLFGLCIGSFLTAVAHRAGSRFRGLATGRSRCPVCGTVLGPRDLVPVLGWLASGGHCRHCGTSISPAYPAIELGAAGIGITAGIIVTSPAAATVVAAVGWWLLALALIDLRTYRLPDALTLPLVASGLLLATAQLPTDLALPRLVDAAAGVGAGFLGLAGIRWLYARLRDVEGLGLGDAKLAAAAGAWLGWAALPSLLLVAASAALVGAWLVHRRLRGDLRVPFGPALALAFWGLLLAAQGPG